LFFYLSEQLPDERAHNDSDCSVRCLQKNIGKISRDNLSKVVHNKIAAVTFKCCVGVLPVKLRLRVEICTKKAGSLLTSPKVLRQAEVDDEIEASKTRNFFNLSLRFNLLVSHHSYAQFYLNTGFTLVAGRLSRLVTTTETRSIS
jgi:hypothetical protein